MEILKEFKYVPYPGYRRNQAKKTPTEYYLFSSKKVIIYLKTISTYCYTLKELNDKLLEQIMSTTKLNLKRNNSIWNYFDG